MNYGTAFEDNYSCNCAVCGCATFTDRVRFDSQVIYLCDRCRRILENNNNICYSCFAITSIKKKVDGSYLCKTCRNKYKKVCKSCGKEKVIRHNSGVCSTCRKSVKDYHHSKTSKHTKVKKMISKNTILPRYFGVELEVVPEEEEEVNKYKEAKKLKGLDWVLSVEEDGSVMDGFEIITQPMTLIEWENKSEEIKNTFANMNVDVDSSCGMHIHINRDGFLSKDDPEKLQMWFYENPSYVEEWSERNNWNYVETYCPNKITKQYLYNGEVGHEQRYAAVNLTNDDTVEVRIFAGTVDVHKVIERIRKLNEIINGLVNYIPICEYDPDNYDYDDDDYDDDDDLYEDEEEEESDCDNACEGVEIENNRITRTPNQWTIPM